MNNNYYNYLIYNYNYMLYNNQYLLNMQYYNYYNYYNKKQYKPKLKYTYKKKYTYKTNINKIQIDNNLSYDDILLKYYWPEYYEEYKKPQTLANLIKKKIQFEEKNKNWIDFYNNK